MCTRSTFFDPIHGLVCPAPVPNAWDFPCLQHFSCWLHHPNFFLSFIHFFQASLPFSLWPAKPAKAHPSQPCTFPRHLEHPQHVMCFFFFVLSWGFVTGVLGSALLWSLLALGLFKTFMLGGGFALAGLFIGVFLWLIWFIACSSYSSRLLLCCLPWVSFAAFVSTCGSGAGSASWSGAAGVASAGLCTEEPLGAGCAALLGLTCPKDDWLVDSGNVEMLLGFLSLYFCGVATLERVSICLAAAQRCWNASNVSSLSCSCSFCCCLPALKLLPSSDACVFLTPNCFFMQPTDESKSKLGIAGLSEP